MVREKSDDPKRRADVAAKRAAHLPRPRPQLLAPESAVLTEVSSSCKAFAGGRRDCLCG